MLFWNVSPTLMKNLPRRWIKFSLPQQQLEGISFTSHAYWSRKRDRRRADYKVASTRIGSFLEGKEGTRQSKKMITFTSTWDEFVYQFCIVRSRMDSFPSAVRLLSFTLCSDCFPSDVKESALLQVFILFFLLLLFFLCWCCCRSLYQHVCVSLY